MKTEKATDDVGAALLKITEALPGIIYLRDEPLRNHTSFRIGGPVRAMFFPDSAGRMIGLLDGLSGENITPLVMGNGTNLLAADSALDIIVINTTGLGSITRTGACELSADAGVPLSALAARAYELGLAGLEFAHGIPGTVGGAVSMNAGAYGSEIKDIVITSEIYDSATGARALDIAGHEFSYRSSRFSYSGEVALSTVFRLREGDPEEIKALMDGYAARRRESQPLEMASAGSAFKRPASGYAAELIDRAGLRGYTAGGAMVSEKHAGFIVNTGEASFSDVMAVIDHVRETVLRTSGVELEPEIRIVHSA